MLRLIFFVLLILLLYFLLHYLIRDMPSRKKTSKNAGPDELVQDPNCQTYIPKRSALKRKIGGQVFYFCRKECFNNYLQKFREKG